MSLSAALRAMDAQHADAFRTAVAALPGLPDDHYVHGHPLIGWVARHGWGEGVEILLSAGSQPKALPGVLHMGIFPTFLYEPDVRPLELLIEAGADVNEVDEGRMGTPLQAAAVVGEERGAAITRLLLAHGADPNAYHGSRSPLHEAVMRPAVDTVRALLAAGARVDERDRSGYTPLIATMNELLSAGQRSQRNDDDNSFEVASDFVPRTVALLLQHGADASDLDPKGRSLLWTALAVVPPEGLIEQLIDAGATVDGVITFGDEELDFLAAALVRRQPLSVLRRLIVAGCPIDTRYEFLGNNTAVGCLAGWFPDAALALIEELDVLERAMLTTRTGKGSTMLAMAAATAGHEALTRRLHAAGLSVRERNAEGKSCLDLTREEKPHMVPLIEELLAAEPASER